MIYIPYIKQRIDELSPKWDKEALSPEELNEFFDLLDEVVLEARESRSDSVIQIDECPEAFLVNLFQRRLKKTVILFFLRYRQNFPKATDEETPQFKEWLGYAKSMTEAIILGDATNRLTRRNQIRDYLEPLPCPTNTEDPISRSKDDFIKDRHLSVNNKRLFALKKELIQQQNALKRESRQRQDNIEWNYTPWAEQCALNEGVGYNPNYKQARLADFSSRLEDAEDLTKSWEEGKYRGLHPSSWTKCVRVVGRIEHPGTREKGSCHETTKKIQHRTQTSGCGRTAERGQHPGSAHATP